MRVAMILNSFPEISEKFLLNQIIALLEAGVDLDIYPAHRCADGSAHDLYEKYHVEDHVRYVEIPRSMRKRFAGALPRLFLLFLKNPGAAIRAVNAKKYRTVASNTKLIWYGLAFNGKKYDVVHCHFGMNGLIGAYIKHCGFARSLVTTFHGSDINTYPSRHGIDVYRELYASADLITVNTSFTGSKVEKNGCPPALIRVLPVGLILSDYDTVDRKNVVRNTILTVGRLVEKKGHEYLARALPSIIEKYPDTVWYIAGDGHLRKRLESLIDELAIASHVVFLGQCTNSTVKEYYAKAAVFVLPSVTAPDGDMEGQGLVLQEAQYCGMPVVSTLHNGIPDGVLDGKSGYLIPEKDAAALADRICHLFGNPGEAASMGVAGREFVAGKYDTKLLAEVMKDWYRELQ